MGEAAVASHMAAMPRTLAAPLAPLLAFLAAACSPLSTFDALVPKDRGAGRVARNLPFGAHPRLKLDLYAPRAADGRARPIVVFIHGGSWRGGSKDGYGFAGRAFAARGFLVAVPNYRLVPEVRYPAFVEDGAAAVRWLRTNAGRYGGDPDRIVLVGHSAGAYNAAMLALNERFLGADRAAVRGWVGLAGPYSFLPLAGPITTAAFGGAPDLPATQPIEAAGPGDPPALLLHGARDGTVRPRNSVVLADRLRAAGVRAEARVYPGVGHVSLVTALARPFRGKAPVLRDAAAFADAVTRKGAAR